MGRYEIIYPSLPPDATGGVWINGVNNQGQVVGWYTAGNARRAFIYDPSINPLRVIDLNTLPFGGGVTGYHLGSAVGINEHQVIVGYLLNEANNRLGFAIDFSAESPVVDLLPNLGSDFSYGMRINENGDVLGLFEDVDGVQYGYLYNPGYYGVPGSRNPRDGSPLDLSTDLPDILPLSGRANELELNNPLGERPAQVGGTDANGIAFRYTTGADPVYEDFPDLDLTWDSLFFGINDSGVFIGNARYTPEGAKGKGRTQTQPFRYGLSVEWLMMDSVETPQDINNSNDLISYTHVYRDGWGWVPIDQLVEGSEADLADWLMGTPDLFEMSDPVFPTDVGYIAGRLAYVDEFPRLFVLLPVPTP
jgi:probable HAF family extracellular repeat protein